MVRLEGLLGLISLGLTIFCLIQAIQTPDGEVRNLAKVWWIVLILLFPFIGAIAWLVAGKPQTARGPRSATSPYPEYERPGRMRASNPQDDEAFLRKVRERAEEQRRRYQQQQRSQKPQKPDDAGATD